MTEEETMTTQTGAYRVAWQSFSWDRHSVRRGEKFRADHPVVQGAPGMFVDADLPQREWPSEFDVVLDAAAAREAALREDQERARLEYAKQNRVKLELPPVMRLRRDLVATHDGRPATIEKGSTALATDPLVAEAPDAWTVHK
jgi:hypothetical protein